MNVTREIACAQVLQKELSVLSVQWTVLPAESATGITPAILLDKYLRHIHRFTLGIVRPRQSEDGIEFRLFLGPVLLRFHQGGTGEGRLTLAINGGILVQPRSCDRGELTFGCEPVPGGTRILLELSDYCPLILGGPAPSRPRKFLYRFTQAAIHRLVTVRFLVRLHSELAGRRVCCRVVKIREIAGEEI